MEKVIYNLDINLVNYESVTSSMNQNVYNESSSRNDCLSNLIRDNQVVYYSIGEPSISNNKPLKEEITEETE